MCSTDCRWLWSDSRGSWQPCGIVRGPEPARQDRARPLRCAALRCAGGAASPAAGQVRTLPCAGFQTCSPGDSAALALLPEPQLWPAAGSAQGCAGLPLGARGAPPGMRGSAGHRVLAAGSLGSGWPRPSRGTAQVALGGSPKKAGLVGSLEAVVIGSVVSPSPHLSLQTESSFAAVDSLLEESVSSAARGGGHRFILKACAGLCPRNGETPPCHTPEMHRSCSVVNSL